MCNGKDPSWFNDEVRQILSKKNELLEQFINCVKSVRNRSYSGSHFLAFGLNTERYSGKMRTLTPNTDTFYVVEKL